MFEKEYGPSFGTLEIDQLQRLVEKYNTELSSRESTDPFHTANERYLEIDVDGDDVIIVICNSLMKRVHHYITHSGELVFIDAGGNMDRHNMRVFLLMTYSVAGGLPLGVLITTNEQAATITRALHLYNKLLDSACFFRRGFSGPMLFMTDDSAAERAALQNVYPESTRLFCIFHVLQAFWRFLWDADSAVPKNDRPYLFGIAKSMVYADSEVSLKTKYDEAMADELVVAHPAACRRLKALFSRRAEWAICCRSDFPTRDNNTNNYCERAMRVLKDSVLHRTKAYNVPQLVDFIVTRFEDYYQRRLQDIANNRVENFHLSGFLPTASKIATAKFASLSASLYEVPSETRPDSNYIVDMHLGSCTCKRGSTGGPCKHQSAVMMTFKERCNNFLPVNDPTTRQLLYAIATGNSSLPIDWFQKTCHKITVHASPKS